MTIALWSSYDHHVMLMRWWLRHCGPDVIIMVAGAWQHDNIRIMTSSPSLQLFLLPPPQSESCVNTALLSCVTSWRWVLCEHFFCEHWSHAHEHHSIMIKVWPSCHVHEMMIKTLWSWCDHHGGRSMTTWQPQDHDIKTSGSWHQRADEANEIGKDNVIEGFPINIL